MTPHKDIGWGPIEGESERERLMRIRRETKLGVVAFASVVGRKPEYIEEVEDGTRTPAKRTVDLMEGAYLRRQQLDEMKMEATAKLSDRELASHALGHSIARTLWNAANDDAFVIQALGELILAADCERVGFDPVYNVRSVMITAFSDIAFGLRKRFPTRDDIPFTNAGAERVWKSVS